MDDSDAEEQITLDALLDESGASSRSGRRTRKPRAKRKPKTPPTRTPAQDDPIAHVMLYEQAAHLGRTFDYLVSEKYDADARPGVRVRVPFGGQTLDGFIWSRGHSTDVQPSSLRFIKSVLSPQPVLNAVMRHDLECIADHFGGTVANIMRVAIPPRIAYVDAETDRMRPRRKWSERIEKREQEECARIRRCYANADGLIEAIDTPRWGWDDEAADDATADDRGRAAPHDASAEAHDASADAAETHDAAAGTAGITGIAGTVHAPAPHDAPRIVWDSLPGPGTWADDVAWMVARALMHDRPVVVVLPDSRHVAQAVESLRAMGLKEFSSVLPPRQAALQEVPQDAPAALRSALDHDGDVWWRGDVAVMLSSMPQDDRYRAFLAMSLGAVRCAVGTRGVMYAPVGDNPLFVLVDDMVYQNADGFMPYANARGVLEVRAREHRGTLVVTGHTRSAQAQWDAERTDVSVLEVHATHDALRELMPHMLWLDHEELQRRLDPTIGARIPMTAVRLLSKGLERGPVLLSLPADAPSDALACASCHERARCTRCTGPLVRRGDGASCDWCGAPAGQWACPECGGTTLRAVRVGARGTMEELTGLLRGVPVVMSSQVQGIVPRIGPDPCVVVATPWCEPFIEAPAGSTMAGSASGGPTAAGSTMAGRTPYTAVAILDAWTSQYRQGLDARIDTLVRWMHATSLCAPAGDGGCVMLLGETFPEVGDSLMAWDPRVLARQELRERADAAFPPCVTVADVWGNRDAVMNALRAIGALNDGDFASIDTPMGAMPSVLGPIPIPPPETVTDRTLDGMNDRVRAVVRVPNARADELAHRLHVAEADHAARGNRVELRFQMYPKDLA